MEVSENYSNSIVVCPGCKKACNNTLGTYNRIREAIINIKQNFGEDIISDPERLNAILMDYVPNMTKERKLIINALKDGIFAHILRGIEDNHDSKEMVARKCTTMLMSDLWIAEEAANFVIDVLLEFYLGVKLYESNDNALETVLIKGEREFKSIIEEQDLIQYTCIGYKAFAYNVDLKEIRIPDSIEVIYPKAFIGCSKLEQISIGKSVRSIGSNAFEGCNSLKKIHTKDNTHYIIISDSIIDVSKGKLLRCLGRENIEIKIDKCVKSIGRKAFEGINVEKIVIPESVVEIDGDAFFQTSVLKEINVDKNNGKYTSIDGVLYSRDINMLIKYPQGKKDTMYYFEDEAQIVCRKAFSGCIYLSSVTFSSNIKEIGPHAFEFCEGMNSVILPRSLEIIREKAFLYCINLTSIMIPQGLIEIGEGAFQGCEKLESVSLPRSIVKIGNMAFAECRHLRKSIIQENVSYIGENAFRDCPYVEIISNGNNYVDIYCETHMIKNIKE